MTTARTMRARLLLSAKLHPPRSTLLPLPTKLRSRCRGVGGLITANRRSVGTSRATVSEEVGGMLSSDAAKSGSERLFKSLDGVRGDAPQIGLHLGPSGLDRAQVRTVGGQKAIGEA